MKQNYVYSENDEIVHMHYNLKKDRGNFINSPI